MSDNEDEGTSSAMFGPLTFQNSAETYTEAPCLLCEDTFNLITGFDVFLKHLFEVHSLVVEDVQNIDSLPEYIQHWRDKFKVEEMAEIIPSVKIDSTDKVYYLLSSLLKEDKELRHRLRLEHALKVQEFERTDGNYVRQCLFCKLNYEGTRHGFIDHLSTAHNFQLGSPQNLVFIEKLVDKVHAKLADLKCIYCEKTFPERAVLKEHMRKKLHKRIHQKNLEYDRFYMVNYLEADKTWRAIQRQDDRAAVPEALEPNTDDDYSDWNEKEDLITCLFCPTKEGDINRLCLHMEADHDFDFSESTKDFDFYKKVKLVNYVRRQVHVKRCVYCDVRCEDDASLQQHLFDGRHCTVPDSKVFDQPEFYFPTYENDAFLYLIDDVED